MEPRSLLAALLPTLLCAQETPVTGQMERLAVVTGRIERTLDGGDRAGLGVLLDELQDTTRRLREARQQLGGDRALAWLERLDTAAAAMREADATAARDRWDFAQLRGACTGCHLQLRDEPDARGLFPNRGNAVFGTLRVEQMDGEPREDRGGAVVFLDRDGQASPPLPRDPTISQKGRRFHPAVLTVTVGTTVRFPNDDVVFHNVFSRSRGNAFDLDTYGKGLEKSHVMANAGLVKVHCNIHPDMAASVLVLHTDRTGISDESGFWCVPDVPDGDYTLRVWHPFAEVHSQPLTVRGGKAMPVELVVRETRQRVQHTDKNGRPYKQKY